MHGTRSPAQRPSARLPASTGLTPAACTATRTWPGPATGSAAWPGRSCSGPPNSLTSTALIARVPSGGKPVSLRHPAGRRPSRHHDTFGIMRRTGRLGRMDGLWNANIHYDRRLAACVPAAAGTVLDAGCGDGFLAARLARRVPLMTAIDIDAAVLGRARA